MLTVVGVSVSTYRVSGRSHKRKSRLDLRGGWMRASNPQGSRCLTWEIACVSCVWIGFVFHYLFVLLYFLHQVVLLQVRNNVFFIDDY